MTFNTNLDNVKLVFTINNDMAQLHGISEHS